MENIQRKRFWRYCQNESKKGVFGEYHRVLQDELNTTFGEFVSISFVQTHDKYDFTLSCETKDERFNILVYFNEEYKPNYSIDSSLIHLGPVSTLSELGELFVKSDF